MNERRFDLRRPLLQCLLVAWIAFIGYTLLYSKLPIDDTSRFTQSVAQGRFEWDATHLFMQPATVLWHRHIEWSGDALSSQHHVNSFAAAISLSLFFYLMLQLKISIGERLILTTAASSAFFVLNLATSGHMKLVAFPFLTLSLVSATLWEMTDNSEPVRNWKWLITSAVSLAVATLCLANSIFILPFQALVLVCFSLRKGDTWRIALRNSLTYATIVVAIVFSVLGIAFLKTHDPSSISVQAFKEFLVEKENENATLQGVDLKERVFRLAYGTVLNFVFIDNLGPMIKAKLRGQFPEKFSILSYIAWELLYSSLVSIAIGCIFVYSAIHLWRMQIGTGANFAAVLGILTFAAYWNLAEAEFYYQLTIPTYAMLCSFSSTRFRTAIAGVLCSISLIANVAGWAIPKAQYPFEQYVSKLQSDFGEDDLIVAFRAYPGKQCMAFFLPYLANRPRLIVDEVASSSPHKSEFFEVLAKKLHERPYRKIILFGILNPIDFNAPIPKFWQMGITKEEMEGFFRQQGEITEIGLIAEIPCWQLKISSDRT